MLLVHLTAGGDKLATRQNGELVRIRLIGGEGGSIWTLAAILDRMMH